MMYDVRRFLTAHWRAILAIAAVWLLLAALFGAYRLFLYAVSVPFAYGRPVCVTDLTPLPNLFGQTPSASYGVSHTDAVRVKGYPIFARQTCISATGPAQEGETELVRSGIFGGGLIAKRYTVATPKRPVVASAAALGQPVSIRDALELRLDGPDVVHRYAVQADGREAGCTVRDTVLRCDIAALGLRQDSQYRLSVKQYFGERRLANVADATVRTALPVNVTQTSLAPQSTVYDRPDRLTLRVNQDLASADVILEAVAGDGARRPVATRTELAGTAIAVIFAQPLGRETRYELTLRTAKATRNGFLEKPYVLPFATSGAPKVSFINIGKRTVGLYSNLVVTFDQPLKAGADYSRLVTLTSGGSGRAASVSADGRTLTIRPHQPLAFCGRIALRLAGDIASSHDVTGKLDWSYASRAICHTVSTIGYSSQGRAIQAYRFGNGPSKVLYMGAMHGDERGTKALMDAWINDLETYPDRVAAHRSIIVIPVVNPDGYAAYTRRNARNVDLNRNFPANNWKSDVTMPGGQLVKAGGGGEALSEPESKALAAFVLAERPRLTLTYHSIGSLVQPNGSGDSSGLAGSYESASPYYLLAVGAATPFDYDTTGAFEDWLHDKLGLPAMVIELGSHTSSEWSGNANAMWKMAQIP